MKNILVIGSGSIAKKHINNLLSLKYNVYVYSRENVNFFKRNKNIFRIVNLNNLPKIYFAIVANKTNEHLKTLEFLVNNKINIYCEKPIYFKKFNFKKIGEKIKKNKLIFFMGYQLLNDSKVLYVKNKLSNVKVRSFQASVGHNFEKWRVSGVRKKSYFSRTSLGGGVIFELIHEINLINYLFGKISNIKTIKSKSVKFKCEDIAVSIIKTKKKIVGTLYQDMFSKTLFRNIKIFAKNKMIEIDFVKNKVFEDQKVIYFRNNNTQKNLLMKNLLQFISKIENKSKSLNDYNNAINDLNVCLKMHNELQ